MTSADVVDVVVVGASLGGLAAAVRLAKLGHRVLLLDAEPDPRPTVPDLIELPAAWRDLFRKSGRILDADLATVGLRLGPAPPQPLADGTLLPADRGEQFAALTEAYGEGVAEQWRDLLDSLDETWQTVRRLGLERPLDPADAGVARLLRDQTTLAQLAHGLPAPLAEHVRELAYDRGADPATAPAWWATQLVVRRTFGRWQVVDADGATLPGSTLAARLLARADHRGVERRQATVTRLAQSAGQVHLELADGDILRARAVVSAVDLWHHRSLLGEPTPSVRRRLGPVPLGTVPLEARDGRPTWTQPETWRALASVSDAGSAITYAGSGSIAGDLPWARLLVGALASYAVHERLTGTDIRPTTTAGHRKPR